MWGGTLEGEAYEIRGSLEVIDLLDFRLWPYCTADTTLQVF